MDRINHSSAQQDKFGAGKDGWTNGDPVILGSGTIPQATWFDGVQEEIVAVIEGHGLTPNAGTLNQLFSALEARYLNIYSTPTYTTTLAQRPWITSHQTTVNRKTRVYTTAAGGVLISNNAFWNGSIWVSEGSNASMIELNRQVVIFLIAVRKFI